MVNPALEAGVIASLASDPRIAHSREIAVVASDGNVELRGTVETFRQRRDAVFDDVASLRGVVGVTSNIHVGTV